MCGWYRFELAVEQPGCENSRVVLCADGTGGHAAAGFLLSVAQVVRPCLYPQIIIPLPARQAGESVSSPRPKLALLPDKPAVDLIGKRAWDRLPACQDPLTSIAKCTQASQLTGWKPIPRLNQQAASRQGAGDDGPSLLAVQTDVPATQGDRGETRCVGEDKAPDPSHCRYASSARLKSSRRSSKSSSPTESRIKPSTMPCAARSAAS